MVIVEILKGECLSTFFTLIHSCFLFQVFDPPAVVAITVGVTILLVLLHEGFLLLPVFLHVLRVNVIVREERGADVTFVDVVVVYPVSRSPQLIDSPGVWSSSSWLISRFSRKKSPTASCTESR